MPIVARALMGLCFAFSVTHSLALICWGVLSARTLARGRPATRPVAQRAAMHDDAPGVSIVMPAFNEAPVIADTVRCALAQRYPTVEVIVVNDGSTDDTLQVLRDTFDLQCLARDPDVGPIPTRHVKAIYRSRNAPRLLVVDKEPSGAKADNSNVGVNLSSYPWVVVMDADELMEPDVIVRCMAEASASGVATVAVGSTLLPSNDCEVSDGVVVAARAPHNYWVGCQLVEYLTAFFLARPGMASIGALPIISGGFGLFSRSALLDVGGYQHGHLGEDMDMCVRLHRWHHDHDVSYEVRQAPEAIVWTEFPPTRTVLARQRIRWHRGLRMIMRDHGSTIGRPRYGTFGVLGMVNLFLFEWLGPLVETLGYALLAYLLVASYISVDAALGVFVLVQCASLVVGIAAVTLVVRRLAVFDRARDIGWLLLWCLAAQLGFRQITVWWRVRSLFPGSFAWGDMPRVGFKSKPMGSAMPSGGRC